MNDGRCVDWQTQKQKVNERGKYLLESGLWSDSKFVVGLEPNERVFSTHKIILSMASPVFEAMFFGGLPEQKNPIPVPDVQPQAFLAMLEYIYGDEVNLHSIDQACELCYVAKKYMIPFLVNQCTAYIWSDVDAASACRAYEFAKLFDEHGLMNKCLQIIAQNTSAVIHGSSFTEIELSTLLTILDLDEMNISSEKEIIHAVHRWAHQQCIHQGLRNDCKENLRSMIGTAFGKIRFLTLSPSEFAANATIQTLLSQSEAYALLMKISAPNAVNTIPDGFSSNNTQRYFGSNQDNKLLYCERNLVQQVNIQNLSQSDSCVVFMVNQDIWFHGIQKYYIYLDSSELQTMDGRGLNSYHSQMILLSEANYFLKNSIPLEQCNFRPHEANTSFLRSNARQRANTPIMEQSMHIAQSVHKMHSSLVWGITNAVLLAILLYDIMYSYHLCTTTVEVIKRIAAIFFVLNTVFHLCRYTWISTTLSTVELTPTQKSLLGVKDCDPYFRMCSTPIRSSDVRSVSTLSETPLNLSCTSWMSSSLPSSEPNKTTSSSQSWLYSAVSVSPQYTSVSSREVIQDEQSLSQYLKGYETFEKTSVISTSTEQPSNLLSTYWSHPASRSSADVSPVLKRCVYQVAPPSPAQALSGVGSIDETGSPSLYHHADVWRKNNINPNVLTIWIANLRMWISQTILERIISEIKVIDAALHSHGLVDITIGIVGLERLKKTAQIPQVAYNVPSLPCLVPFLEISTNQEYVVQRIRELAKGGSMSEYKWNSGGTWNGKEWGDHLPTDAALVMHLVATYLDSQLPPLPSLPDGRPFSFQHFARLPNEPTKNVLTIVQVSANPPHYQLQTKEETYNIPKGRNNLFCTILLFLHIIKTKEHGMLGRINLGRSGVNMLCVIES